MDLLEEELLNQAREMLEKKSQEKLADDELICECMCVSAGDIRNFTREKKENLSLEKLKSELKLGSGCSSCTKTYYEWREKL